jgi:hypothetical protein
MAMDSWKVREGLSDKIGKGMYVLAEFEKIKESPSYVTSRLGIAEAIDYLFNTDFQSTINYLLVAATSYTSYTQYTE